MKNKNDIEKIAKALTKFVKSNKHLDTKDVALEHLASTKDQNIVEKSLEILKIKDDRFTIVDHSAHVKPIVRLGNKEDIEEEIKQKEASLNPSKPKDKVIKQFQQNRLVAHGRSLKVIDINNFHGKLKEITENEPIHTNESFIGDFLRDRLKAFWSIDEQNKNFVFVADEQKQSLASIDFHNIFDDDKPSNFGRTIQNISLESNTKKFVNAKNQFSKSLWKSFIEGKPYVGSTLHDEQIKFTFKPLVPLNFVFYDHAFEMTLPIPSKTLEFMNGTLGVSSAKIEPQYNFLIEEYENLISLNSVLENTLPNMYVMLAEAQSIHPNPEFKKMISLDGAVVTDTKKLLSFVKKGIQTKVSRVYDLKNNSTGEYYDLFARHYEDALKNKTIEKLDKKFKNIAISIKEIGLISNFNTKEELFPLNITLAFSSDKTSEIASILKTVDMFDPFMNKMIQNMDNKTLIKHLSTSDAIEEISEDEEKTIQRKTLFKKGNYRTWNLSDIIGDFSTSESNAVFLDDYEQTSKIRNSPQLKFFRSLSLAMFNSKLQTLINQHFRSFEEMMAGKMGFSETVFYRIAKFGPTDKIEPIQNIFIPNDQSVDVIEYIDTQVKYDKQYTYVVYAYQFVIGNKYAYSDLKVDEYDHHSTFKITQEPSIKIIEVPYYNFSTRVIDKPPAPPDLSFVSYKGIDNQVLLLFNNNSNAFKAKPIFIKSSDELEMNKVRENQRTGADELIEYAGDDRISHYEVYRLKTRPSNYSDFQNALHHIVDTDVSSKTMQKATSAAFVDSIEPNKKYYYVFRAIDIHGHISNPTSLYEIEVINENGTIFLLNNIVDFKEEIEKVVSKTMKRFIQIIPTVTQSLIDEKQSGFNKAKSANDVRKNVALSLAKEKLWGKTFRIRLISKNTGKKIDFDVNFQHQSVVRVREE